MSAPLKSLISYRRVFTLPSSESTLQQCLLQVAMSWLSSLCLTEALTLSMTLDKLLHRVDAAYLCIHPDVQRGLHATALLSVARALTS